MMTFYRKMDIPTFNRKYPTWGIEIKTNSTKFLELLTMTQGTSDYVTLDVPSDVTHIIPKNGIPLEFDKVSMVVVIGLPSHQYIDRVWIDSTAGWKEFLLSDEDNRIHCARVIVYGDVFGVYGIHKE